MRVDRPIGTTLLLWPTLAALWLAAHEQSQAAPDLIWVGVFALGTFLTRSAGCVINDFLDRGFDGKVQRTQDRPLAKSEVKIWMAVGLAICLLGLAALLIYPWPRLWPLAAIGAVLMTVYPLTKRWFNFPQAVLGIAFSWGIPMAWVAMGLTLDSLLLWVFFAGSWCWVVAYDSFYALTDRKDDLGLGLGSTAVALGPYTYWAIGILQLAALVFWGFAGWLAQLAPVWYLGLGLMVLLFVYQHWLARQSPADGDSPAGKAGMAGTQRAFLANDKVGMLLCIAVGMS